jgi:calcineurin-like phosphoesterase family protein
MGDPIQRRRRQAHDLVKLPRSAALSQLYRSAERLSPPNHPPLSMFSAGVIWDWVKHYLKYVFNAKHGFVDSSASPVQAVYPLTGDDNTPIRVAIAGDWGTGTDEAAHVASTMEDFHPHYTIHLGDVYYVGDPPEVNENCLGIPNPENNYDPVRWPLGSLGSFAMNGNHEMYANGNGFFDLLLPKLGLRGKSGETSGQQTSFFCLQNRYWRIVAIDTGYNSIGLPILSQIPILNRIPGIGGDCKLPDSHVKWLNEVVKPGIDRRGIILLAHHQYYSAFEGGNRKPAQQLWNAGFRRPVLWFWGHEHRMAGYDLAGPDNLQCYGRCIGHGGMPVEVKLPNPKANPQPQFYDHRRADSGFGHNGSVNLTFHANILRASYIDVRGEELLNENWTVDGSGAVVLLSSNKVTSDIDFVFNVPQIANSLAAKA